MRGGAVALVSATTRGINGRGCAEREKAREIEIERENNHESHTDPDPVSLLRR